MVFPHLRLSKAEPMSVLEIKDRQLLGPWWSRLLSSDFPSHVPLTPDDLKHAKHTAVCSCYFCLKCRHFHRHMTCPLLCFVNSRPCCFQNDCHLLLLQWNKSCFLQCQGPRHLFLTLTYYKSGSPGSLKFPKYKELRKAQLLYLRAE